MSKLNKYFIAGGILTLSAITFANLSNNAIINSSYAATEKASTLKNVLPDTAITADVKGKLLTNSKIEGLDISVTTVNGVVTLEGAVSSNEVKNAAINAAKSADGVKEVVSKLTIAEKSSTIGNTISDSTITAAVKSKLIADKRVEGLDINVETFNGKVILKGTAANNEAKEVAISIAKDTKGVKEVVSEIK